ALGTAPQDPWSYGERIEAIAREYLELRYQLLPYIYSTFAQCAQDGIPIVRPLFMIDPYDRKLRDIEDEFMLGDTILVAPILEPSVVKRDVYLPDGMWYEHATGRLLNGAQTVTAAAPLEQLPLYFRAGKVVPMWPVMQYVGEKRLDTVRLRVYAGTEDTTIYEDAGEGMEYQHGAYRWSYFTCRTLPTRELIIEWRRAGQYQPPYDQVHIEVVGIPSEPERVMLDDQSAPIWYYENEIVELVVKPFDEVRIVGCTPPASQASTLIRPPGE
ncbi:MAG: DUF5110 domain-containing protein, partial [Anaerolineae bacterium]|nr:DUF5110 domain-containing protein [Anaerolineae bacterium]